MTEFWRWIYWLFFELRVAPSIDELMRRRDELHEEREELELEIAANERAIKAATLQTGDLA